MPAFAEKINVVHYPQLMKSHQTVSETPQL